MVDYYNFYYEFYRTKYLNQMLLVKNKKTGLIFEVGTNSTEYTTITTKAYELAKSKYNIVSGSTLSNPVKKNVVAEPAVKSKPKKVIDL